MEERKRIWVPVTGMSPLDVCMYCGVLTSQHFFQYIEIEDTGVGVIRKWVFCDDICVEKFKKAVAEL